MGKIEISIPEAEKALPILRDAIERQKHLLMQTLAKAEERIRQLSIDLQVDPARLLAGECPHSEAQDMDLVELEGELELRDHLREQLQLLEQLKVCP